MSEIYIPTHLVPEEILNQLKEIAQGLHHESIPVQTSLPSSSPTPSLSSPSLSSSSGNAHNIPLSSNSLPSPEHVSLGEVTSAQQEVTKQQRERPVSVNDVSDATTNSLSNQSTQSLNSRATVTAKQMETHKDSKAGQIPTSENPPPLEINTRQKERQSMGPSASSLLPSPHLQTSQHYEHCPAHGRLDQRFHPSSRPQQWPDLTPLSTSDDVSRLTSHLHQPPTSVAETETNSYSSPSKVFKSLSVSDSTDDAGGTFVSSVRSPSCMSSVSQQSSHSAKEETVRVIPPRFATPSEDVGSRNPIFLTPPETPEGERKRGVPEVFTFDDLACAQERFWQMMERLRHLQEEHTHHGSWSNSGSSSSLPVTPSYRQVDCPSSAPPFPSYRPSSSSSSIPWPTSFSLSHQPRHHPRPQTQLKNKAAVASVSPLTHVQSTLPSGDAQTLKNAAEVVRSPPPPLQSPRCFQEIHHPRRKTAEKLRTRKTSVQPTVSSEQFPSHHWESLPSNLHKGWNYDTESLPYVTPDQGLLKSGSPNVFSFPDYPITESHFGRSGSDHQNWLRPSEEKVDMRVLSPVDCQDVRDTREECGEDSEAFVFAEPPTPYDTVQFCNQLGLQDNGQTLKKGRFDLKDDRTKEEPPCACVIMERNLLQMAESAYRWLRRQDASLADFERFRSELALTNEKLRESMDILKHIRDICDHQK